MNLLDRHYRNSESLVQVGVDAEPGAWVFKGRERADVHGEVCDDCGHLQLFVVKRDGLREADQTRKMNRVAVGNQSGYIICSNGETSHKLPDCPKCGVKA